MRGKIVVIVLILAAFLISSSIVYAGEKNISVCVDGSIIDFSQYGQEPISKSGRVLVPFRQIFESLGYDVSYNNIDKSATISKDDNSVQIWKDKKEFIVNETEKRQLDEVAQISASGRFVLPVRAVCEALGMELEWNQDYKAVFIFSNEDSIENKNSIIEAAKPHISDKAYNKEHQVYHVSAWDDDEHWQTGLIDGNGDFIVPFSNDFYFSDKTMFYQNGYSDGLIATKNEDYSSPTSPLYGYMDCTGEYAIPPQFCYAESFGEGLAGVTFAEKILDQWISSGYLWKENGCGMIDTDGNVVYIFPDGIEPCSYFCEGRCMVIDTNQTYKLDYLPGSSYMYNYIDKKYNLISDVWFAECANFSDGIGICAKIINNEKRYGAIDKNGNIVVPFKYRFLGVPNNGRILAIENSEKPIIIDYNGNKVFSSPFYSYVEKNKWYTANSEHTYQDGLLGGMTEDGQAYYIDIYGNKVYSLNLGVGYKGFPYLSNYDGYSIIQTSTSTNCIDKNGNVLLTLPRDSKVELCRNGVMIVYDTFDTFSSYKVMRPDGTVIFQGDIEKPNNL